MSTNTILFIHDTYINHDHIDQKINDNRTCKHKHKQMSAPSGEGARIKSEVRSKALLKA